MNGVAAPFIPALALAMGATAAEVGFLAAVAAGVAAVSNLLSGKLVDSTGKRKQILTTAVFFHAFAWIVLLSIPFVIPLPWQVSALIVLYAFSNFLATFPSSAWASMMADIVPSRLRGSFFSMRNQLTGLTGLIATAVAGFFLGWIPDDLFLFGFKGVFFGFGLLFFVSFATRIMSWHYLGKMKEYPYEPEEVIISPVKILEGLGKNEYLNVVFFIALANTGMALATPFFAVYLLNNLQMGLGTFGLITTATGLATIVSMPYWGRISDWFGRKKMLWVCTALLPTVPLAWIFFHQPWQLFAVQLFYGFILAGFNLNAFNHVMDSAPSHGRTTYLSFYNFANNMGLCIGGIGGGFLLMALSPISLFSLSGLTLLFVVSSLFLLVPILWLTRLEEKQNPIKNIQFIWNTAFMLPSIFLFREFEHRRKPIDEWGALTIREILKLPSTGIELSQKTQVLLQKTEKTLEKELGSIGNFTVSEMGKMQGHTAAISKKSVQLLLRTIRAVESDLRGKELINPKSTKITEKEGK